MSTEVSKVAAEFGLTKPSIEPLGNGIIHHTYKAGSGITAIVLQQINTYVFAQPEALAENYLLVHEHLSKKENIRIPAPIPARSGDWLTKDSEGNFWRATEFINNAYAPDSVSNASSAYTTAVCFGKFAKSLQGLDISKLHVILADFHDLHFRYQQFEDAISRAELFKAMRATHLIAELRQRKQLVDFYQSIKNNNEYPVRLMHHDCKIGNILFDIETHEVICPIDLDTIMPGKFFSDLGDMIRTMAPTENEESRQWEKIDVKPEYYDAIVSGYLMGIGDLLTEKEKEMIHLTGIIMTYMQSLRFITDFLNKDIYYKTTFPEQNLNRALNQLILLEKLEEFVESKTGKKFSSLPIN